MASFFSFLAVPQHKVFISFRGIDLRTGFVAYLRTALKKARINAFIDVDDGLGKDFKELFERIEESRIALVIFSRRFTESQWCLNELVKMKECAEVGNLIIIPIFYKVEPKTVKKLERGFTTWLWGLLSVNVDEEEKVTKWNEALNFVSRKRGLLYEGNSNECDFIDEITESVKKMLFQISEDSQMLPVIHPQENGLKRHDKNPKMPFMLTERIHSNYVFANHNNLEQAVKDMIISYAERESLEMSDTLHPYKRGFQSEALCHIEFPGCEVPSWFHSRVVGSKLWPNLPLHWHEKRLYGMVLCAVVSFQDNRYRSNRILVKCTSTFRTEDGSCTDISWNVGDLSETDKNVSDHVFVCYTSFSDIKKRLEAKGLSESILREVILEFEVADTTEVEQCKVMKCGFSLVYEGSNWFDENETIDVAQNEQIPNTRARARKLHECLTRLNLSFSLKLMNMCFK